MSKSILLGHNVPLVGQSAHNPLDQLTSLRFFAAVYVLVFHSGSTLVVARGVPAFVENVLFNGYLGVSFFFILSGFILTYAYAGAPRRIEGYLSFIAARFARIYPVYFLSIIIIAPFFWTQISAGAIPQFFLMQCWTPPARYAGENWNGPAWTLSIEAFFYLLFPLMLWTSQDKSVRHLVCAAIVVCSLILILRLSTISIGAVSHVHIPWLVYVPLPVLRLGEFVYGTILARLHQKWIKINPRWNIVWIILSTLLTGVFLFTSRSDWSAAAASVGFGSIILFCSLDRSKLKQWLSFRPLVLLGSASYAIYILQTPVREWIRNIFVGEWEWFGRGIYYPVLFGFSLAIFYFYEEPARAMIRSAWGRVITEGRRDASSRAGR